MNHFVPIIEELAFARSIEKRAKFLHIHYTVGDDNVGSRNVSNVIRLHFDANRVARARIPNPMLATTGSYSRNLRVRLV